MKTRHVAIVVTVIASLSQACSSSTRDFDEASAGTNPGGGSASSAAGSGGAVAGGTGGASSGGSTSSAGSLPMAGTDAGGGGAGAGSGGDGGSSGAGEAGSDTGGSGGSGGSGASTATPSAGCAKASGRPQGGVVTVNGERYFTFPESYDGTKPFPVLWGFHGCGEVNRGTSLDSTEWIRLTESSAFKTEYVRAVPLSASSGGCWNYNTDITRVKAAYDALTENYCVDVGRNFATGHSSGSQFIVQILTNSHAADAQHLKFKGIAPVAASDYGALKGPMPVMYIQGKMDAERNYGDGHETVERLRAANSCMSSSQPFTQVMGCQSGATNVNPGCIAYDGCTVPTIWCSHNDPAYGGTMHGVPCFGVKAMYDFFESL